MTTQPVATTTRQTRTTARDTHQFGRAPARGGSCSGTSSTGEVSGIDIDTGSASFLRFGERPVRPRGLLRTVVA
ncbi:hypothetical protein [Nocardiopsis sp. CNR-923]|uniref:hypothetical protein n=1 Tax=Nocardiopsis sp. CNR-923 TaxID=1904965 RepID=UPI0013018415|nr:hypothetical protein [Nocardiopsis sp. CNR-923]